MVRLSLIGAAAALVGVVAAATSCGADSHCPESAPCCSQYGECGTGAYCLGGCDPRYSFAVDACTPAPVCKNQTFTFADDSSLVKNTVYLGDADEYGWVYSGYPLISSNRLLVTMPNQTDGTLLASTAYVWYGKISVTMKSSRGQGVVTAFVLLSDTQDEIDFEFLGYDLNMTETNYYSMGILDYYNEIDVNLTDTFSNYHTYEYDWQEDSITWSIDGQVGRTLHKNDTYNSTSGGYNFPQTPSRVELSIWPGGLSTNSEGTIQWAGGEVDWNSVDIEKYGYDYAIVRSVSIECYDPPSGANITGSKSYRYVNRDATADSVSITDDDTVLASFANTGLNMTAGASSSVSDTDSSTSSSSSTSTDAKTGTTSTTKGTKTTSSKSSSSTASSSAAASETGFSQGSSTSSSADVSAGVTGLLALAGAAVLAAAFV
ncbi:concanavalin A-like lectin/glucanase domain-containing protein [Dipodascopsis tothii]|uniref:concanavalin A-like lectin/glucanase domain-containing protein n=1 Tax=Dipodascopsis tothii TaxID=44089 RepID=UPI0034D00754